MPLAINQKAVFTIVSDGEDIEGVISEKRLGDNDEPCLVKIVFPKADRAECLAALDVMNINHLSIYPSLRGAARFCNIGLETADYARFPGQGPE